MSSLKTLMISVLVSLSVLLALVWFASNQSGEIPLPPIERQPLLEPGNKLSRGAICQWYSYPQDERECNIGDTYFSYSMSKDEITSTIYTPKSTYAIGNLILLWGQPDGEKRWGLGVQLYWTERWAWTLDDHLRPESRVALIGYYNHADAFAPWRGFTSR